MREYIKAHAIVNEIRMKQTLYPGNFLIVETDTEAQKYKRFGDASNNRIVIAHTKDNITQVLNLLQKDNFPNILTTKDIDLEEVETPEAEEFSDVLSPEFWNYEQDPLWDIVGLGASDVGDLSTNHDQHLIELDREDNQQWPRKSS